MCGSITAEAEFRLTKSRLKNRLFCAEIVYLLTLLHGQEKLIIGFRVF